MNSWTSGLFDCFSDCSICLYGFCCPACLYGENAENIDGSRCCDSGCLWYLMSGWCLCCLVHTSKRKALRQRFDLREDCNDCIVTTFCSLCAICQEARELKHRSVSSQRTVLTQPMNNNTYNSFGMTKQEKF